MARGREPRLPMTHGASELAAKDPSAEVLPAPTRSVPWQGRHKCQVQHALSSSQCPPRLPALGGVRCTGPQDRIVSTQCANACTLSQICPIGADRRSRRNQDPETCLRSTKPRVPVAPGAILGCPTPPLGRKAPLGEEPGLAPSRACRPGEVGTHTPERWCSLRSAWMIEGATSSPSR